VALEGLARVAQVFPSEILGRGIFFAYSLGAYVVERVVLTYAMSHDGHDEDESEGNW